MVTFGHRKSSDALDDAQISQHAEARQDPLIDIALVGFDVGVRALEVVDDAGEIVGHGAGREAIFAVDRADMRVHRAGGLDVRRALRADREGFERPLALARTDALLHRLNDRAGSTQQIRLPDPALSAGRPH